MLTDSRYLGSVVDCLEPRFFKNKNISKIVEIINDFFLERSQQPTITEVKSKLTTDELRDTFKNVVAQFKDIDSKFNQDELYENTENFLKEKAVSLAKGYASDAFAQIGIDGVGLHGAIGFTAEYDAQLYLKRSKWARPMYGDSDYHLDRIATLGGL